MLHMSEFNRIKVDIGDVWSNFGGLVVCYMLLQQKTKKVNALSTVDKEIADSGKNKEMVVV